jgi:hypothetical protein
MRRYTDDKHTSLHRSALASAKIFGHVFGIALTIMLLTGCSRNDGPQRYTVSGKVTYDGKPVPKGFVTFSPDTEAGNSGPGGGAEVRDGVYQTAPGKGVVGGPHRVRIIGFDGIARTESGEELADGAALFPTYQSTVDFPKADATHDFEVTTTVISASGE